MSLLRLISGPYVRKHKLRCLLTVAGIVLGVAVFVAMHTANQSVLLGFRRTVEQIAGRTQLQISAGEAGLDEEVLERVIAVPGVRTGAPVIEATVQTGRKGEGNLLVLAVDMVGDTGLRDYNFETANNVVPDPLEFLAQPDSLIVSHELAERTGLQTGSKLTMQTMDGEKQFTVRGILRAGGITSAFGGNLAIMDIYAAQKVFGRGRKFDRIDVAVTDDASVERVQKDLQHELGPAFTVEPPERRSQNFEALLGGYSALVNITSVFALLIGVFVIYNSFSIAVTQRRSEIGILRALGATRGQIRTLFLAESAIAGVVGSAGGMVVGLLAAQALARLTSGLMTALSGTAQAPEEIAVSVRLLALGGIVGLITSMIAAWLPARSAARVDPVYALQKGRNMSLPPGENRMRRLLAFIAAALSIASLLSGVEVLFYAGYILIVVSAVLLSPALSLWLAQALRGPLRFLCPVEGTLAADSLIQAPRRTSAAVTGLMLSIAIAVSMAGVARATLDSIEEWATTVFNADLVISTSESLNARSFHFPASMEAEIEALPGVSAVQAVRTILVPVNGWPVMIIGLEMSKTAVFNSSRPVVAGDRDEMYRLAEASKGLIVSENLTLLQKLRLGDTIEVRAPAGVLRLPIVGIVRDYANQTGSIFIDLSVLRRYWKDDSLDLLYVYLRPGANPREAKQNILTRFQAQRRLFVFLNAELRKYVLDVGNQWFGLAYVQIGVAVLVAVLGIVNALTVSIVDRRRELGMLRAVGAVRNQVRRTLWMEAVTIAFVGVVLGLTFGAVNLYYQIETVRRSVLATPLDYRFPSGIAFGLVPVMLAVAFLSALAPAESAVRGSLIEALEYE